MKFSCENCGERYSISEDRIAGKVLKIRCKKCGHLNTISGEGKAGNPAVTMPERPGAMRERLNNAQTAHVPPKLPPPPPRPGAPAAKEVKWFFSIKGVQQGPFDEKTLIGKNRSGLITNKTMVWRSGMDGWKRFAEIPELMEALESGAWEENTDNRLPTRVIDGGTPRAGDSKDKAASPPPPRPGPGESRLARAPDPDKKPAPVVSLEEARKAKVPPPRPAAPGKPADENRTLVASTAMLDKLKSGVADGAAEEGDGKTTVMASPFAGPEPAKAAPARPAPFPGFESNSITEAVAGQNQTVAVSLENATRALPPGKTGEVFKQSGAAPAPQPEPAAASPAPASSKLKRRMLPPKPGEKQEAKAEKPGKPAEPVNEPPKRQPITDLAREASSKTGAEEEIAAAPLEDGGLEELPVDLDMEADAPPSVQSSQSATVKPGKKKSALDMLVSRLTDESAPAPVSKPAGEKDTRPEPQTPAAEEKKPAAPDERPATRPAVKKAPLDEPSALPLAAAGGKDASLEGLLSDLGKKGPGAPGQRPKSSLFDKVAKIKGQNPEAAAVEPDPAPEMVPARPLDNGDRIEAVPTQPAMEAVRKLPPADHTDLLKHKRKSKKSGDEITPLPRAEEKPDRLATGSAGQISLDDLEGLEEIAAAPENDTDAPFIPGSPGDDRMEGPAPEILLSNPDLPVLREDLRDIGPMLSPGAPAPEGETSRQEFTLGGEEEDFEPPPPRESTRVILLRQQKEETRNKRIYLAIAAVILLAIAGLIVVATSRKPADPTAWRVKLSDDGKDKISLTSYNHVIDWLSRGQINKETLVILPREDIWKKLGELPNYPEMAENANQLRLARESGQVKDDGESWLAANYKKVEKKEAPKPVRAAPAPVKEAPKPSAAITALEKESEARTGTVSSGSNGVKISAPGGFLDSQGPSVALNAPVMAGGKLDPDNIARTMGRYTGSMKNCYEAALRRDSSLAGRVELSIMVEPNGKVSRVDINGKSIQGTEVEDCIVKVSRGITFPPYEGGSTEVKWPLILSAN
ncbi:MAG: hypothetical protein GMKNLPBB_03055 [Myxococcota bacterium]|nr:hypothetical protein [Myxococcota bacterium]